MAEENELVESLVRRGVCQAEGGRRGGPRGGGRRRLAGQTIFLMLGRLKLPVLRCF